MSNIIENHIQNNYTTHTIQDLINSINLTENALNTLQESDGYNNVLRMTVDTCANLIVEKTLLDNLETITRVEYPDRYLLRLKELYPVEIENSQLVFCRGYLLKNNINDIKYPNYLDLQDYIKSGCSMFIPSLGETYANIIINDKDNLSKGKYRYRIVDYVGCVD